MAEAKAAKKTKTKSLSKAEKWADKHSLADAFTVDEKSGNIEGDDSIEAAVLDGTGVTADQLRQIQENTATNLAAVTRTGGNLARDYFDKHGEMTEMTLSYGIGHDVHKVHYDRNGGAGAANVTMEIHGAEDKGELNRAFKAVQSMFEDL